MKMRSDIISSEIGETKRFSKRNPWRLFDGAIFVLLIAILINPISIAAQMSSRNSAMKKRLDAVIDRAIKEENIVGTTMLVAQNGKIIYRRTAGLNDCEAKKPLRETDVFRLASMTKLIVSVVALALVDEGKLGLDDAVTKYLPEFRPKLTDGCEPLITVRHLLTHTAGFNYGFLEKPDGAYHRLKVSDGLDDSGITLEENLRRIAAAPLLYEPGTSWNYSVATDVLGAVVAKAGGAPLPEVVRRKVTEPLKMNDTKFVAENSSHLVTPYGDGKERPVRMTEPFALPFAESAIIYSPSRATDATAFPSGGGGMSGTIDDYFRFLEVLRKGGSPILKPETTRLLFENAIGDIPVNAAASPEGWGWSLGASYLKNPSAANTPQSAGTLQWGGAWGHSYFVDRQKGLTVISLTNTAVAGMVGEFPTALVNAVYGKKQSISENTNMQQILIDKFIVPLNAKEEFLKRLDINRNFIKNLPGFIEDTAYEDTKGEGEISYVTVAVWENAEALDNAKKAVSAEYQKQGFDPTEMYKRLNIKIERGVYKKMDK